MDEERLAQFRKELAERFTFDRVFLEVALEPDLESEPEFGLEPNVVFEEFLTCPIPTAPIFPNPILARGNRARVELEPPRRTPLHDVPPPKRTLRIKTMKERTNADGDFVRDRNNY